VAVSAVLFLVTTVLWILSDTSTIWVLNYSSHVREPSIQTSGYQIDIDSRLGGFYLRAYPIPERWADMMGENGEYQTVAFIAIPLVGHIQIIRTTGRWYYFIWLRYAYIALLAALLPGIWLWQRLRELKIQRRIRRGQCRQCGYDLRATPDRCPECGTVVNSGST
jgi:hypothetical protein